MRQHVRIGLIGAAIAALVEAVRIGSTGDAWAIPQPLALFLLQPSMLMLLIGIVTGIDVFTDAANPWIVNPLSVACAAAVAGFYCALGSYAVTEGIARYRKRNQQVS
jgi:hypothetical protein